MTRLLSAVAFVAFVALSCSASLVNNVVVRQPIVPEDVIGTFTLATLPTLAPTCPRVVVHTETIGEGEDELSHSVMTQNGGSCDDGGVMTIFSDPRDVKTELTARGRRLVNQLLESSGQFIWAVELDGRDCDGDFKASELGEQTLVVLVNPEERIPNVVDLIPGSRYMIIDDPTRPSTCIYSAPLRDAEPSGPPAESPDDDDSDDDDTDDEGVVVPVVPVVPVGNGTAAPTTTLAVPVAPVTNGTAAPGTTVPVVPVVPVVPGDESDTEGVVPVSTPLSSVEASIEASAEAADGTDDEGDETDDDDGSVCFPASARVETEGGETKAISHVELGDRLKVGDGIYSDVFMFTHKDVAAVHDFVRIETTGGHSISATKGHYIYINGVVAAAGSAKVGDVLDLGDGSKSMINKISVEKSTGLFNPQTVHGDIIVNSVRATTFTRTIEPATAQAMLAPFRMVYDVLGWSSRFLDNGADLLAQALPKGQATF